MLQTLWGVEVKLNEGGDRRHDSNGQFVIQLIEWRKRGANCQSEGRFKFAMIIQVDISVSIPLAGMAGRYIGPQTGCPSPTRAGDGRWADRE
jgi:hypothetical protein